MTKKQFDFIGKRKWFLLFAALVLVAGLIVNIILGTELDINFKGSAVNIGCKAQPMLTALLPAMTRGKALLSA